MYLWRKVAAPRWLNAHEAKLPGRAPGRLAVIAKPRGKRLQIEIACGSRPQARPLLRDFGGRIEKLPHNWWKRLAREPEAKPFKIGKRLVITRSSSFQTAETIWKSPFLVIPAGAAFGTGEHAGTAMSLRLLEEVTRGWRAGWSIVDLGTGTGILALAAKRFGVRQSLALDLDPTAISTAQATRVSIRSTASIFALVTCATRGYREKSTLSPRICSANY
jgi:ribosomal protein L11 methyltransferase